MSNYLIIAGAYLFLVLTSGFIIKWVLKLATHKTIEEIAAGDDEGVKKSNTKEKSNRVTIGVIIGKCENIIILTFLLLDAYTALALVVTAKTIVRKEEIEKK